MAISRHARRIVASAFVMSLLTGAAPFVRATAAGAGIDSKFRRDLARLEPDDIYRAFVHFGATTASQRRDVVESHGLSVVRDFRSVEVVFARGPAGVFRELMAEPAVTYLEANRRLEYFGDTAPWTSHARVAQQPVSGGPYLDPQGRVLDGSGVGVAIVDSGINAVHPDLRDRVVKNFKIVCSTPGLINTQTQQCFGPLFFVEAPFTDTTSGHGTHVAGIVAGDGTGSTGSYTQTRGTYLGVAPGASLYGYSTGEVISVLFAVEAFNHILTNFDSFVPRIRVVNNSWGDPGGTPFDPNSIFTKLTDELVSKGITVVYAAGNDGGTGSADETSSTCKIPTPGVICVANYDDNDTGARNGALNSTSSRGRNGNPATYPDVSAPGTNIRAACIQAAQPVCNIGQIDPRWQPWYASISGTSMAAPHVSGAAAMLYQAVPTITPAQVEDVLLDTAHRFTAGGAYEPDSQNPGGTTSFDKGAGLVDVPEALRALGIGGENSLPASSVTIFDGDSGDYRGPGVADLVSLRVANEPEGLRYTLEVRDIDDAPAGATLRLNQNIDGKAFTSNVFVTATSAAPSSSPGNAPPTEVTRDTQANTASFLLPYGSVGDPAPNSPAHNVFASSFITIVQDIAPGGQGIEVNTSPRHGHPYTVRPQQIAEPVPSPTPTPEPTPTAEPTPEPSPTPTSAPGPIYYFHSGTGSNNLDQVDGSATFDSTFPTFEDPASAIDVPGLQNVSGIELQDPVWRGDLSQPATSLTVDFWGRTLPDQSVGFVDYTVRVSTGGAYFELTPAIANEIPASSGFIRVSHTFTKMVEGGEEVPLALPAGPFTIALRGTFTVDNAVTEIRFDSVGFPSGFTTANGSDPSPSPTESPSPSPTESPQPEERSLPITERVSIATNGTQGNAASFFPSISADGRFVVFHSSAFNLVSGDTNGSVDIFVYDRVIAKIDRVSVATDGTQANAASFNPSISADGRFVAFFSHARNLVPGDTNGAVDLFVHDRHIGTTERVSVAGDGGQSNHVSTNPSVSADGRLVAFNSFASNLVPGDTNERPDVFIHDRQTGATERVSVASDGAQGNHNSYDASISSDGRYVAFYSEASNLVPGDTNRKPDGLFSGLDVFVHDRDTGSTQRISVASDGTEGNNNSFVSPASSFSADGRYVVFYSTASNLVPGDTNRDSVGSPALDVFVHDRATGSTERVSVASDGTEGNSHSLRPTISGDGRYVAFHSVASNLVPGDTNYNPQKFSAGLDVFVHDRHTGAIERASVASDGAEANQDSSAAAMSADGRYIAFHSFASNLVSGDTNGVFDVFVRDRGGPAEPPSRGNYPAVPNDSYFSDQWGPLKIRAPEAWQQPQATGFAIRVAVIDSGVDLHDDLRCPGKLARGASVIDGKVQEGQTPDDVNGHGTHVAGIIGACTNNRSGTAGVAPDATLVPYRVFSESGTADFADVAKAITLATDSGAHVINLSLGPMVGPLSYVPGLFEEVDDAIERAASEGVVLVAAAGNDSMPLCEYPALAEDVICVGATDRRDLKAWYSTFPNRQDDRAAVVAPGGNELVVCDIHSESILSLFPKEFDNCNEGRVGYRDLNGTSMAAPHVSGVAALVYDRLGGIRSAENAQRVVDAIVTSAVDLGRPGRDPIFGSGRVDALGAVIGVGGPEPSPSPSVSASESTSPSPSPSESPPPERTSVSFTERSATSGQYSDETHLEARLVDSDGDPIEGQELAFELTGPDSTRTFGATTDTDGVASVTPTLQEKPGPHQLTVRFSGDDTHEGSADTTVFVVEKEDTDLELAVSGKGKNRTVSARLSDRDTPTAGVVGRTIDFYADGKFIGSAVSDQDGVAILEAPPRYRGGKHNFEARFEGDDFYLPSSDRER